MKIVQRRARRQKRKRHEESERGNERGKRKSREMRYKPDTEKQREKEEETNIIQERCNPRKKTELEGEVVKTEKGGTVRERECG